MSISAKSRSLKRCISVPDTLWEEFEKEVAMIHGKKSTVVARLIHLFVSKRREARKGSR